MIKNKAIRIEALRESDVRTHPVWTYTDGDEEGNIFVRPVSRYPVSNLGGKLVATQVLLGNGKKVWAIIGNVDLSDPIRTKHFIAISILWKRSWCFLARYHDFNFTTRGPDHLAEFLGLKVDHVFPIKYDISAYAKGDPGSLSGIIVKDETDKLTRAQLIAMAVPRV